MSVEFWTAVPATPLDEVATTAAALEAAGWDGLGMVDSQNLAPDPYVFLTLAALGSRDLGLMTSVTNVVTRHAATTAGAAFSVQAVSGGRFVLGIGRGDSALAHIGRSPARLAWFEQYLASVAAYCRGQEVPFDQVSTPDHVAAPVEDLGLADRPDSSRVRWAKQVPAVPIEVAGSGKRVIGAAARHADRIMFALGAEPERVAWGIAEAKKAAEEADRNPADLSFGAYVNVVAHQDRALAIDIARGAASLFVRFSTMHGTVNGPADDAQRQVYADVHRNYDMNRHARNDGAQTKVIPDDFLASFAIVGSVDHCVDRLAGLVELGIDKFSVSGASHASRNPEAVEAAHRFIHDVVPQVPNSNVPRERHS